MSKGSRRRAMISAGTFTVAMFQATPGSSFCESRPTARLVLHWSDPHGLFTSGFEPVGRELEELFAEMDVELSLTKGPRETETPENLGRQIRIVVVQTEAAQWKLAPRAMGAIMSRQGPQSEIYIFFNSVVRTLGYAPGTLRSRWPTEREKRDLARAFSRVIAHEVVHAVLPSHPHASDGLTHFKLDRRSLLEPGAHVDASVAEAFRAALFAE